MSMIGELVKNLRDYAEIEDKNLLMGSRKSNTVSNLLREAAHTIEELSAKVARQSMDRSSQYYGGGWIPCSERLTESSEVLCQDKYGEMMIGYPYKDNESETGFCAESDECIMYNCIAWQPLPPAYEPKED